MERYGKADMIGGVWAKLFGLGYTRKDIARFYDAQIEFMRETVLSGGEIVIPDFGVIKLKATRYRPARHLDKGIGGVPIDFPPVPPYTKMKFHPNIALAKEIRKKTMGNPFK